MDIKSFLSRMAARMPLLTKIMRPLIHPFIAIATRDNKAWIRAKTQRFQGQIRSFYTELAIPFLSRMAVLVTFPARIMRSLIHPFIAVATRDNKAWIRAKAIQLLKHLKFFSAVDYARKLYRQYKHYKSDLARIRMEQAVETGRTSYFDHGAGIGSRARGKKILMLVVSDLRIDPRVEREARALAAGGYDVHVLCPDPTQGKVDNLRLDWGSGVRIQFLPWQTASFIMARPGFSGALMFANVLKIARREPLFALHAHDLNTCYVGLGIAKLTGAQLVVDFHEWTSENVHWDHAKGGWAPYRDDWKAELQALEARLMREASAVVTVCDSIADALALELGAGRRALVVRNIPALSARPTKTYPALKEQLGLPESQFVLLWQGGTGPTRLIEPIIEALAFAPRCTFVIRGPSLDLFGKEYQAIADRIGASDRLILEGPVPSSDVVAAARGADAGIWTLPALCRNFTYALPNKIFEYIASGLPTLVADYPEARRMVETHKVGLTFYPYDPKSIAKAINRLIDDPSLAQTCRDNTITALTTLNAKSEWEKLVTLYDDLPRTPSITKTA